MFAKIVGAGFLFPARTFYALLRMYGVMQISSSRQSLKEYNPISLSFLRSLKEYNPIILYFLEI